MFESARGRVRATVYGALMKKLLAVGEDATTATGADPVSAMARHRAKDAQNMWLKAERKRYARFSRDKA